MEKLTKKNTKISKKQHEKCLEIEVEKLKKAMDVYRKEFDFFKKQTSEEIHFIEGGLRWSASVHAGWLEAMTAFFKHIGYKTKIIRAWDQAQAMRLLNLVKEDGFIYLGEKENSYFFIKRINETK